MSRPSIATAARAGLCTAVLGLAAGAAQASLDVTAIVGGCSPANLLTLQYDLKLTNGAVRKAGRNPPSSLYFCDFPIDDLATATKPTWTHMQLQYIDRNTTGNGNLTARLMRKSFSTGAAVEIARVSSTPAATTLRTLSVALPAPLDPKSFKYFFIVSLSTPTLAEVEAHTVRLVTR